MNHATLTYFVFVLECNTMVLEALIEHHPLQRRMRAACYLTLDTFLGSMESCGLPLYEYHLRYSRSTSEERIHCRLEMTNQGWELTLECIGYDEGTKAVWYPQTTTPPIIKREKSTRRGRRILGQTTLRNRAALITWMEKKLK